MEAIYFESLTVKELMGWHVKVTRGRSLSNSSRNVVDRAMAGAEPTAVRTVRIAVLLAEGYAATIPAAERGCCPAGE